MKFTWKKATSLFLFLLFLYLIQSVFQAVLSLTKIEQIAHSSTQEHTVLKEKQKFEHYVAPHKFSAKNDFEAICNDKDEPKAGPEYFANNVIK